MHYSRYITLITALLTITGYLALTLVEELSGTFLISIGLVTAVSLALNALKRVNISHRAWNVLAIITLALFVVDYLFVSENLVEVGTRVTSVLIIFKLYDLRTGRDFTLFAVLVFLEVLAAAASTASPLFFALLAAFVLTSIWAMTVFNVKGEYEKYSGGKEPPPGIFGMPFLATTAVVTIAAMAITMALFFVIPRMAIGFFETKTLNTIKVVGFSDVVDLGSFGEAKLNTAVVMRIEPLNVKIKAENLYLRGAVLDSFDGKRWSRSKRPRTFVSNPQTGLYIAERKRRTYLSQHKILLEPIETDVIFAPDGWSIINGRFRGLLTDSTGSIYLPTPAYSKTEYTVHAYTTGHDIEEDKNALSAYLTLPRENKDLDLPRITALANSTVRNGKSDMERALLLENHLSNNYAYTLSPTRTPATPPVDDFLFHAKQGYCEHFATSMALMLRSIGIPSRVITGYVNGEYSDIGKYYIIRQSDAHSWVEAYIKGTGWVRFDPTPSQGITGSSATSALVLYLDSLTWHWNRYVINYTLSDQIRIAVNTETAAAGLRDKIIGFFKSPFKQTKKGQTTGNLNYSAYVIGAAIIALLAVILFFLLGKSRKTQMPKFYKVMIEKLEQKGLTRKTGETPRELARRSNIEAALLLTDAFYKTRYGHIKYDAETEDKLLALAKTI